MIVADAVDIKSTETSENANPLDRRIPALDGVRGLAVLLVLATTFAMGHEEPTRVGAFFVKMLNSGWWGVDLFFVLSGFLITGILLRTRDHPNYLRNFYSRRGLRVFPLYFALLTLAFVIVPLIVPDNSPGRVHMESGQGWLWTYTSNIALAIHNNWWRFQGDYFGFGHTWSLAVEEHFYLFWPWVVLACRPRRLAQVCVTLIVVAFAMRAFFLLGAHRSVTAFVLTPCRMDALVLGSLVAVGLRYSSRSWSWVRAARMVAVIGALGLAAMLLLRPAFSSKDPFIGTIGVSIVDWFSASLVFLAVTSSPTDLLRRAFSTPVLRSFGKYSYSIYLLSPALDRLHRHWFGLAPLTRATGSTIVAIALRSVLVTACAYAVAWLTWHLYEMHFLRLKRLFGHSPADNV